MILLGLFCLWYNLQLFAVCENPKMMLLENQVTEKKTVKIWVKRFVNEGKKSLILSHAFCLSSDVLTNLARELCYKGFDVWLPNMRGHGRGEYKSLVNNYEKGDYGFES